MIFLQRNNPQKLVRSIAVLSIRRPAPVSPAPAPVSPAPALASPAPAPVSPVLKNRIEVNHEFKEPAFHLETKELSQQPDTSGTERQSSVNTEVLPQQVLPKGNSLYLSSINSYI